MDACSKDHGGTVLVPAGVFVIGTVEMKSNVTLHIAAGGKLLGSADGKQYQAADAIPLQGDCPTRGVPPPSGRGDADRPYHLLFHRCTNLRIRGLFLVASGFHSIRIVQTNYVWVDGIHIHNRVNGNNDGLHFISSQYMHVSNCRKLPHNPT